MTTDTKLNDITKQLHDHIKTLTDDNDNNDQDNHDIIDYITMIRCDLFDTVKFLLLKDYGYDCNDSSIKSELYSPCLGTYKINGFLFACIYSNKGT